MRLQGKIMEDWEKKDKQDKQDKQEPKWYERTSDGTAWYEKSYGFEENGQENLKIPDAEKEEKKPIQSEKEFEKGEIFSDGRRREEKELFSDRAEAEERNVLSDKTEFERTESFSDKTGFERKEKVLPSEEWAAEYIEKTEPFAEETDFPNREIYADGEEGKIFLPDILPEFAADKISDEKAYIRKKLLSNREKTEASEKKKYEQKKKTFQLVIALFVWSVILFILGCIVFSGYVICGSFILFLVAVIVWASKIPLWKSGADLMKKIEKFQLIRPYAVKRECVYEVSELIEENSARFALRLYYQIDGAMKDAATQQLYTETEIETLEKAFVKGKLVAACLKDNFLGDTVIVCEPQIFEPIRK
mgnify:FL=1